MIETKKCPVCGRRAVEIDGMYRCLYCGRAWDDQPVVAPKPLEALYAQNERICEQAHKNLLNNIDGSLTYCLSRGMTEHLIKEHKLGYTPAGYRMMTSMWERRLLFPIFTSDGKHVCAFGGRKIVADDRPKYVNSYASPIYNKSESLYGYNLVPEHADTIYLCEGYVDVLSMDVKGFAYPVASLGTALTIEQSIMIRKKASRVVVCYDADEAGQKNALRAIDLLATAGFKTNEIDVMVIADAKDVDEALQHGCTLSEQRLLGYLAARQEYEAFVDALINT